MVDLLTPLKTPYKTPPFKVKNYLNTQIQFFRKLINLPASSYDSFVNCNEMEVYNN